MRFVETHVFTDLVCKNLDDDEYRALQSSLLLRPEQGPVIPGSGGLRKVRWGSQGKGKRGGLRLIYFWDKPTGTYYMLFLYRKNEQGDLTKAQVQVLGRLVREEFRMKREAFEQLVVSVRQAGRIRRGAARPSRTFRFAPADVKAIRKKLGKSQSEFALMIGVSVATLRNWEQGRRTPEGPALALLRVVSAAPRAVTRALRGAA